MFSAADLANRLLEREPWARTRLASHDGRVVRALIGSKSLTFVFDAYGRVHDSEANPDLTLTVSPLRLPTLLAQPERWSELVVAEGDSQLAATLSELALAVPWFVEATLAKALGPIVGQKLADIGRHALALPDYGSQRFTESVVQYLAEEARMTVGASEAHAVAGEIAALAARVDALARRIDRLDVPTPSLSPPDRTARIPEPGH